MWYYILRVFVSEGLRDRGFRELCGLQIPCQLSCFFIDYIIPEAGFGGSIDQVKVWSQSPSVRRGFPGDSRWVVDSRWGSCDSRWGEKKKSRVGVVRFPLGGEKKAMSHQGRTIPVGGDV